LDLPRALKRFPVAPCANPPQYAQDLVGGGWIVIRADKPEASFPVVIDEGTYLRIERRIGCHRDSQGNTVFRFLFSGAADAVVVYSPWTFPAEVRSRYELHRRNRRSRPGRHPTHVGLCLPSSAAAPGHRRCARRT